MRVAYRAAGVGQIWYKKEKCPSLEDLSHSGLWPNVARDDVHDQSSEELVLQWTLAECGKTWCPLLEGFVSLRTFTKCGPNCAPHWRTLSRSRLRPNVVQIVPLIRGLCHAADFDQMWSKMCPLLEDFVSLRTLTKCSPKCAPH